MIMWYRFDQIVKRYFLNPLNFYKIFKLGQIPQIGGYDLLAGVRLDFTIKKYKSF